MTVRTVSALIIVLATALSSSGLDNPVGNSAQQSPKFLGETPAGNCLKKAKIIGIACRRYAREHDGNYPQSLMELVPGYLTEMSDLVCPLSPGQAPNEYEYFGGKVTDPATNVLLRCKHLTSNGGRAVIYSDLSGELLRER
jgi:hypothetical protein